jgi:hypothetical protein
VRFNNKKWLHGKYLERSATLVANYATLLLTSDESFLAFHPSLVFQTETPIIATALNSDHDRQVFISTFLAFRGETKKRSPHCGEMTPQCGVSPHYGEMTPLCGEIKNVENSTLLNPVPHFVFDPCVFPKIIISPKMEFWIFPDCNSA